MNDARVDPAEPVTVTVYLRRPERPPPPTLETPGARLRRSDLNPAPDDIRAVQDFATRSGLAVVDDAGPGSRFAMLLRGTVASIAAAFGVSDPARSSDGALTFRSGTGPLKIPDGLHGSWKPSPG